MGWSKAKKSGGTPTSLSAEEKRKLRTRTRINYANMASSEVRRRRFPTAPKQTRTTPTATAPRGNVNRAPLPPKTRALPLPETGQSAAGAPAHKYPTRGTKAAAGNGKEAAATRHEQPALIKMAKRARGRPRKTANGKVSTPAQPNPMPPKRGRKPKNSAGAEKATVAVSKKPREPGHAAAGAKGRGGREPGAPKFQGERQSVTEPGPSPSFETDRIPEEGNAAVPVPLAMIKQEVEVIDLTGMEEDLAVPDTTERHYRNAEYIENKAVYNGVIHYHLKWAGLPSVNNTWEPLENLVRFGCQHLVDQFENFVEDALEAQPSQQEQEPSRSYAAVTGMQVPQVQVLPLYMNFPASLQLHAVVGVWGVSFHLCYMCRFKTVPEMDDYPYVDVSNTLLVPAEGLRYEYPEKVIEFYERNNFVDESGTVRVMDKPSGVWAS